MAREDLAKTLLAAARAAVDAGGLGALNARALAEAAGCSVGMVYNAYPGGLDELVRALNGETLDELHEAFLAAAVAGRSEPRGEATGARRCLHRLRRAAHPPLAGDLPAPAGGRLAPAGLVRG
jgi:AcrR family transcriptional regulator